MTTAAKAADVAVVFLGISEAIENEGHDRTGDDALELPGHQLALAQACVAVSKSHKQSLVTCDYETTVV